MLYQIIIVIHILLGLSIIGLVLMQHGKGADAGAAFGSAHRVRFSVRKALRLSYLKPLLFLRLYSLPPVLV